MYTSGQGIEELLTRPQQEDVFTCTENMWHMEKIGPFHSSEDSSWHYVKVSNAAQLRDVEFPTCIRARTITLLDKSNDMISDPPLHLHHSSQFPGNGNPSSGDVAVCYPSNTMCYIDEFPAGYGQQINSELVVDAMINDLRFDRSEVQDFYLLLAFRVSPACSPLGFYHVLQPPFGRSTSYEFDAPPSRWLKWFQWVWPHSGTIQQIFVHGHWSFGEMRVLLFSGSAGALGLTHRFALGQASAVYEHNLSIATIMQTLLESSSSRNCSNCELRCIQESSGYISLSDRHDRRVRFPCSSWRFSRGTRATAVILSTPSSFGWRKQHVHFYARFFPEGNETPNQLIRGYDMSRSQWSEWHSKFDNISRRINPVSFVTHPS